MPALRVKRKTSKERANSKELLKRPMSPQVPEIANCEVERLTQAVASDSSIQERYKLSYCTAQVPGQNKDDVNYFEDAFYGLPTNLLMVSLLASDPTSVEMLDPMPASYPCNLETIFSPDVEHSNSHLKTLNEVKDEYLGLPHLVADGNDDSNNASSDLQLFSLLDFYISENISLNFDSLMGFSNDITTVYNECTSSDMVADLSERHAIFPFSINANYEASHEQTLANFDDTCLYLQMKTSDQETEINCFSCDLEEMEWFDQQLLSRELPDLLEMESSSLCGLANSQERKKPITLVLDLDETLVHSTLDHCDDADFTLQVYFNMKHHTVYVRKRPHLQAFLEKVARMFEIVIFTASLSIYAEQLLDKLDPDGNLICRRVYRESCIFSDGGCTKDLTILGVDLAKIAIIDNSPQVFRLQANNGIPIKSWFDDPSDHALVKLLPFLETLADVSDVRPLIAKEFGNKE